MAMYERVGNINVWWFPKDFSQSRYGEFQHSGTNSCTLISLVLADKIAKESNGFHRSPHMLTRRAHNLFGISINTGNSVYCRCITPHANKQKRNQNLNIPDAMRAIRSSPSLEFHLHEWFYTHMHADPSTDDYTRNVAFRLAQIFHMTLELYKQPNSQDPPRYLFAALIADCRTVIMVFEIPVQVAAIFDSHQHGRKAGAVFAQASFKFIHELTYWFVEMLEKIYGSKPALFEISFLTSVHGLQQKQKKGSRHRMYQATTSKTQTQNRE